MEIILVASEEIYNNFLAYGFTGSWRKDSFSCEPMKTFFEITGIDITDPKYLFGAIITPDELHASKFETKCVTESYRLMDMYCLKEWLRLVLSWKINIAII
jgi:hypothetical protein